MSSHTPDDSEEDEYVWVRRVPVIDEAMIERAADELRIIDDEWDAMSPMTNRGMAERVLRAALEIPDE